MPDPFRRCDFFLMDENSRMNSLIITLDAIEKPMVLPIAYQHILQGLLYAAWKEALPSLHDDVAGTHLFTFSPLEGPCSVQNRMIRFNSALHFELRSPFDELTQSVLKYCTAQETVRLGKNLLRVENLEIHNRMIFPDAARIRMRGMVTVHENQPDGSTRYYTPEDAEWLPRLRFMLKQKLHTLGMAADDRLEVGPLWRTLRKRVTSFKGTWITGYSGSFEIRCDPAAMAVLYYCGLGSRNSQGCGMFDIENRE